LPVLRDIKAGGCAGVSIDDVDYLSPIEHPDIDEILERKVNVQKFTFTGAVFGVTFGFFFLASAQASFLVQPQGGKAVVPFPTNFVLMYEMLIFFGIWTTVFSFLFLAGLLRKRGTLYSEKLTVDQCGIMLEVDEHKLKSVKEYFKKQKSIEIREEAVT
ncbi:MAG: DUF3341 domain-containing protein, partial [Gammaproteobacteria bacterium]|nr:DUF3341 domain-containing protein [Gammaproteobacteria bacterium]